MFNNIKLYRYNKAGTQEIERVTVPLTYSSKEKFYVRITQDPTLAAQINLVLPRMAFELTGINYDPLRKTSSFIEQFTSNDNSTVNSVRRTPYNFEFSLYIFVRNTEDGTQIIEQILPYFTPDYTLTLDLINNNALKADVPIILQSVSQDITDDTGESDQLRTIVWTLTFTMKGYLYGPVEAGKLIRKSIANTYSINTEDLDGVTQLNLGAGFGTYQTGELVYQGYSLDDADVTGFVTGYDANANVIYVSDTAGNIKTNTNIVGAISNASYNVVSFGTPNYQLMKLIVQPDPLTANANDAFGFAETLQEAPNIT